ncbi:MAG: twin-arginine translocation signal domain-containing protein [Candidatus Melainabacteria bacterium]|nr:twin-arginine translocation signal domain-containing protein [Candidatus Melainabacteria bacterium]
MSIQINRRDFLVKVGAGTAAIAAAAIAPVSQALAKLPSEPIKINSWIGQRTLWLYCDAHSNLPKLYTDSIIDIQQDPKVFSEVIKKYSEVYPINKWPDLKKQFPNAFTRIYLTYKANAVEENAQYVVECELASRAKEHFFTEIKKIAPEYTKEDLGWILYNFFFGEVRQNLHAQKGIPDDLNDSRLYDHFVNSKEGIFTSYTEDEAEEILKKIAQTSPQSVLDKILTKYDFHWKKKHVSLIP